MNRQITGLPRIQIIASGHNLKRETRNKVSAKRKQKLANVLVCPETSVLSRLQSRALEEFERIPISLKPRHQTIRDSR